MRDGDGFFSASNIHWVKEEITLSESDPPGGRGTVTSVSMLSETQMIAVRCLISAPGAACQGINANSRITTRPRVVTKVAKRFDMESWTSVIKPGFQAAL
jgi:hypothetical protein